MLGIAVPCGQSCPSCSSSSNVLGVSVQSGVRTVVALSFACQSVLKPGRCWRLGLCSIHVQSCFQELSAAPPWRHQEGLGAEGSEQLIMHQELPRQPAQSQTGGTGMLGAHRLPQHPLTCGAAAITCTLPLPLKTREFSCSWLGLRSLPQTACLLIQDGAGSSASACWHSGIIHLNARGSSCPAPTFV